MTAEQISRPEHKIAGAPISWGVCEVPGWGYQLGPGRVLKEMHEVGLMATELGPDGFLPSNLAAMANVLAKHGLQAVGGFTPLLLHVPEYDPLPEVDRILNVYVASGAQVLVLSAVTGSAGYDTRPQLDQAGWKRLLSNLDRVAKLAADRGVRAVLHPHVGTMIEAGVRGAAGAARLVDLVVPRHRSSIHRRDGSCRAGTTSSGTHRTSALERHRLDDCGEGAVRSAQLQRGRETPNVPATRSRGRRRARPRRTPSRARLQRLVHPRTGRDPQRRAQERRACRGCAG